MPRSLAVNATVVIPAAELKIDFARSSGPGGQNVNKVNTKAVLHWQVAQTPSLPEDVRRRFLERYKTRINTSGELVLSASAHREQGRNVAACREKLREMIAAVLVPQRRRVKSRPPRAAVEHRLRVKQQTSQKKKSRRIRDDAE